MEKRFLAIGANRRSMSAGRAILLLMVIVPLAAASCVEFWPVINVPPDPHPTRTLLYELHGGRVFLEKGLNDGHWLEIDRPGPNNVVGGYYWAEADPRDAIVVMLHGASMFSPGGSVEAAREFHKNVGVAYRSQGFHTWSLAVQECGTPYGQGDLFDLLAALDWLDRDGKAQLGVNRVYLVGYSIGGTVTTLANRMRDFTAGVTMGGLTQPDQFLSLPLVYDSLTQYFRSNEAFCQLRFTLQAYGPAGSPGWDLLDTVAHIDELRNPQLFVHATKDIVYFPENTYNLEARYLELRDQGVPIADLNFIYLPDASHFEPPTNYPIFKRVIEYFERFEPRRP